MELLSVRPSSRVGQAQPEKNAYQGMDTYPSSRHIRLLPTTDGNNPFLRVSMERLQQLGNIVVLHCALSWLVDEYTNIVYGIYLARGRSFDGDGLLE